MPQKGKNNHEKQYLHKQVVAHGMVGTVTEVFAKSGFVQLTVDFGKGVINKFRPGDVVVLK